MINKKLLEVLRLGILEIRLLSTKNNQDIERINKLSNILHNIPNALGDKMVDFDFAFLKEEIVNYKKLYNDGVNFLDVLKWNQTIDHHTDHLSGSSVETDKNGFAVEVLDYYPYGSIRTDKKYTAYENDKKFTGYELDASGLYYAGQRYYNSEIGRFTSVDSAFLAVGNNRELQAITGLSFNKYLSNPQVLNGYSYTVNNPLKHVDKSGEFIDTVVDVGFVTYDAGNTVYKGGQFVGSLFSGDLQKASNASQAFLGTFVDLGFDTGATLVPFLPAGLTHADDAGRWANKLNPDFRPGRVTKGVRDLDISNRAIKSAKDIAGFTKEGMNQIVTRGLSPGIIQDTLKNTVKYTQRIDSL